MNAGSLAMLIAASGSYRRIYVGRKGVELCGFSSGTTRFRPLWLWLRGYLQYADHVKHHRLYGWLGVYLVPTAKGRKMAVNGEKYIMRRQQIGAIP